jgi:hypothetical protein
MFIFSVPESIMNLTHLPKARRKRGRARMRSLLDRWGKSAGADKSTALPTDASARFKELLRARLAAKHSR